MRLLFCCERYFPSGGGVAEVMRQVAERLLQRGHQVTVATSRLPERTSNSHNGVQIEEFAVGGNLVRGMRGEIKRYQDFVRAFGADAILIKAAQQWTFDALWPVLGRIAERKVFIPCGFGGLYEPAYAAYFSEMPEILRKFDHLIFYAEAYRDIDFARAHGLRDFSVVPNGASEVEFGSAADPSFRTRLGVSGADFIFLTVGAPLHVKGHVQVAEAFARLETNGRPATLILNGDWSRPFVPKHHSADAEAAFGLMRARRRAAAVISRGREALAQTGLRGFSTLIGRGLARHGVVRDLRRWIGEANSQVGKRVLCTNLHRGDLVQAYLASDMFVFASMLEYSPLVLFEAAAAGTPFLSVPVGNAREIATQTGGGVICEAAVDGAGYTRVDPQLLAGQMASLMHDRELLARLGATGKERWRRNFTWRSIAPRYEAILRGPTSLICA